MKNEGVEPVEILHKVIELKPPERSLDPEDQLESSRQVENIPKRQQILLSFEIRQLIKHPLFEGFDLKFRFRLPDLESRRKLWGLNLRKEIAGSGDIDVEPLAQRFHFSGAQIALVVQNACIEAIGRKGESKRLSLQDLLKFADLEQPWSSRINKSIGF